MTSPGTLRAACDDGHAVVVVPSSLGAPCDACGAPLRAADAPVGEAPWARVTGAGKWHVVGSAGAVVTVRYDHYEAS